MNVFKRMGDIISSNVNSLLDKMEDPEKMIDLSITELEDAIRDMKATIAEKKAETKGLEDSLIVKKEALDRWIERAKLASDKGEDDMAREAISEKLRLSESIKRGEESLVALKNLIASLEQSKDEAISKLTTLKEKSLELKSRAKSAKEKIKVNEAIGKSENARFERRIAEIKAKIDKWEAEADIPVASYKRDKPTFEDLERSEAIEQELAALKANNN